MSEESTLNARLMEVKRAHPLMSRAEILATVQLEYTASVYAVLKEVLAKLPTGPKYGAL